MYVRWNRTKQLSLTHLIWSKQRKWVEGEKQRTRNFRHMMKEEKRGENWSDCIEEVWTCFFIVIWKHSKYLQRRMSFVILSFFHFVTQTSDSICFSFFFFFFLASLSFLSSSSNTFFFINESSRFHLRWSMSRSFLFLFPSFMSLLIVTASVFRSYLGKFQV